MKKNHFIARKGLFSLALAAVGAMFLGSCAVDGFDDKEKFDDGVRRQARVTRTFDKDCSCF